MFPSLTVSLNPSGSGLIQQLLKPLAYSLLSISLSTAEWVPAIAHPAHPINQSQTTPTATSQTATDSGRIARLPTGTYLYGQAPQPNQMGYVYLVLEVNQGDIVAALYMPRSSFDCATGNVRSGQLALTVTESYSGTTYPVAISLKTAATVSTTQANPVISEIELQGLRRLPTVSKNDQRILNVCKAAAQA